MKTAKVLQMLLAGRRKRRPSGAWTERLWKLSPRGLLFLTVIGVALYLASHPTSAHIDSLVPNQWTAGGPAITLRLLGTDFDASDTGRVLFNGTRVVATLISDLELRATIPAGLLVTPGTVSVTLEGFNSASFTINPPPTITTGSTLPDGLMGHPYSLTLMRTGGTEPFVWTWTSGGIPGGTSFNLRTGVLSGTPVDAGTYEGMRFGVTDAAGLSVSNDFSLTIRSVASCVNIISPDHSVADSDGDFRTFQITAPAECIWTAFGTSSWIRVFNPNGRGSGRVEFEVLPNDDDQSRTASVYVSGLVDSRHHSVTQNPNLCPAKIVCKLFPSGCAESALSLARSFRDEALVKRARGARYTKLYYQFSNEAVQIVMLNPVLVLRSRDIFERYKPVIEAMAKSEQVMLTEGDLAEIEGFLDSFARKGSPEFRETLNGLCDDLRDPQTHSEFNITVTEGPTREIPPQGVVKKVKQIGMMTLPVGLLLCGLYAGRLAARKPTRH